MPLVHLKHLFFTSIPNPWTRSSNNPMRTVKRVIFADTMSPCQLYSSSLIRTIDERSKLPSSKCSAILFFQRIFLNVFKKCFSRPPQWPTHPNISRLKHWFTTFDRRLRTKTALTSLSILKEGFITPSCSNKLFKWEQRFLGTLTVKCLVNDLLFNETLTIFSFYK